MHQNVIVSFGNDKRFEYKLTPDDVAGYKLSRKIRLVWLEDGDHSFKPRKSSGRTLQQNLEQAVAAVADFVDGVR